MSEFDLKAQVDRVILERILDSLERIEKSTSTDRFEERIDELGTSIHMLDDAIASLSEVVKKLARSIEGSRDDGAR